MPEDYQMVEEWSEVEVNRIGTFSLPTANGAGKRASVGR